LGSIAAPVRSDFEIAECLTRTGATDSRRLVSTSMFNHSGAEPSGPWSYEMFNDSVIRAGRPEKYWLPLKTRRADYAGCRMRIYLAANLKALARPLLEEIGFDEVCVMARPADGYKTGMLWRYLPLAEREWEHVFCTGIDRYGVGFRNTMLEPCTSVIASVWMNRHFMPFAGPISANPSWLAGTFGGVSMAAAMSGFLTAWEAPRERESYIIRVFNHTGSHRRSALPAIDACFLWYALWNPTMLNAEPRFVSQVFYEFLHVRVVPFLLGETLNPGN
jgi:hypothetical protein